jgi:tRNA threonylcarbamoyladenosine biosynthesis protein TsaB
VALVLALDTATRRCSVVLCDGTRVLAFREEESERLTHAERLNVFIGEVLREAGAAFDELEAVAVGIGPGSYTGLRIGLSAAKGLCYALRIPIIGMGTLDILVRELLARNTELTVEDRLMPMIDARRMEVFTLEANGSGGRLSGSHPLVLDAAWTDALDAGRRTVVFGDGADKASGLWPGRPHVVHVPGIRPAHRGLASCADDAFERKAFSDLAYLVPDYGKPANVTQPLKSGT